MPERTDPPQDKEPKEIEPIPAAEDVQPPGEELPEEVEKALAELVEATLENFELDPDPVDREDSVEEYNLRKAEVREYILHKAEMIYQTPARTVQQLKGQRRGPTPGFGGLLPRQIRGAVAQIEKAIADIQRFNKTPAFGHTRIFLQNKYGDETPIKVEVVREEEVHVLYDYRIFDWLPELLDSYIHYVRFHIKKASKHPFRNNTRSQFKAELLAFVQGSDKGKPLYALPSRFMQAYVTFKNRHLSDDEWDEDKELNEFDPEVLGDFARKNIARATSYELSAFAPMEELFPENPDEE